MGKVERMRAFREARYTQKQKSVAACGESRQQNPAHAESSDEQLPPNVEKSSSAESSTAVTRLLPAPGKTIQHYSDEQILAVVEHVVHESASMSSDLVVSEVMRYLGFHRRGKIIVERIQRALDGMSSVAEAG